MKKRFFFLPFLVLFLFACKNPAGPSNNPPPAPSGGAIKAKVQFDASKIMCRRNYSEEITPETEIKENDSLEFYPKLTGDDVVKTWYLNEVDMHNSGTSISFRVKDDVVMEGSEPKVIKVRYTIK